VAGTLAVSRTGRAFAAGRSARRAGGRASGAARRSALALSYRGSGLCGGDQGDSFKLFGGGRVLLGGHFWPGAERFTQHTHTFLVDAGW
jgi:hypothetical protein